MPRSKANSKANENDDSASIYGKNDKRKFNRGASQRRSYTKEEKLSVITMKDSGMSYDDIFKQTGFSRVNMEKWCSVKGRESIIAKASKAASMPPEKPVTVSKAPLLKKQKAETDTTSKKTPAPPLTSSQPQSSKRSNSDNSSSNSSSHRENLVTVISQPAHSGITDTFPSSGEESGEVSDEEYEHVNSAAHLLRLVKKEQEQIEKRRKESNLTQSSQAPITTTNKRKPRGESAAALLPPPETGYFPHQHKPDAVSAMVPKHVLDKEFVRVNHTNYASNITMSISDTMLKPDFSAMSGQGKGTFDMTTTQQATRPVVSNTKLFRLLHEERKKQRKAEGASQEEKEGEGSVEGSIVSAPAPKPAEARLKTKRRVLEVLCNSDSDQEKEDSRMLMLLGE